jgi:hypothetical protein
MAARRGVLLTRWTDRRPFAAYPGYGRFPIKADIHRHARRVSSLENDPSRHFHSHHLLYCKLPARRVVFLQASLSLLATNLPA